MRNTLGKQFSRAVKTYEKWALPQKLSARLLVEFTKPRGLILDLGCGTGFVSQHVKGKVVGLDISKDMLLLYKERFGNAVLGDAHSLPFSSRSFDYVLSNFSLHWTDWRKTIPEALRVARKGVGLALPVEGSLSFSSFPFPKAEEIISLFEPERYEIRDIDIPFLGWELVKFFHYTGTSNYEGKKENLTRTKILKLLSGRKEKFRVLYLLLRP
ncbi:MAG: class I SAM-dependent methyltransferase [Aquificae bacterium]|nr:class I SAM-dependent methyltransferase [Aquificota bacterium]